MAGERPKTRGECPPDRPCPWVSCRYNLALDITQRGQLKMPLGKDPAGWHNNCALDWADRGPMTLEDLGSFFGITRERIRQIEAKVLKVLRGATVLREHYGLKPSTTRGLSPTVRLNERQERIAKRAGLSQRLQAVGIRQRDVAEALEVSLPTVRKIVRGDRRLSRREGQALREMLEDAEERGYHRLLPSHVRVLRAYADAEVTPSMRAVAEAVELTQGGVHRATLRLREYGLMVLASVEDEWKLCVTEEGRKALEEDEGDD